MRTHIWIRKDNVDWWREYGSSDWVNKRIMEAQLNGRKPPKHKKEVSPGVKELPRTPLPEYRQELERAGHSKPLIDDVIKGFEACKHGAAKGLCKKGCR